MEFNEVMTQLQKMGTAQNVKVYKRHGAGDNLFGVSFANLNTLKKKIKTDHSLALKLWSTGNSDARILATMVADPVAFKQADLEAWLKNTSYYMLADYTAGIASKTPYALKAMKKWMKSKDEFVRASGYSVMSAMLRDDREIPITELKEILQTIEKEIHKSPNRARHSMLMGLIAIGIYRPELTEAAKEAAKRIGKVEVDHGETSCKTPDAVPYIEKALKRAKPIKRKRC